MPRYGKQGSDPVLRKPPSLISVLHATGGSITGKPTSQSAGLYQQSLVLRSRLQSIPAFALFYHFSQSGTRATKDVVHQLWETFALGQPLCLLYNLQDLPEELKIASYPAVDLCDSSSDEFSSDVLALNTSMDDSLEDASYTTKARTAKNKDRKRAIALFIMAANQLKQHCMWDRETPMFSISDLTGEYKDTNGFVKVIATVNYLLDKLPSSVWARESETASFDVLASHDSFASLTSVGTSADPDRMNSIRELIETERKYCQDLEVMQVSIMHFS